MNLFNLSSANKSGAKLGGKGGKLSFTTSSLKRMATKSFLVTAFITGTLYVSSAVSELISSNNNKKK